jgi:hypothetical protein
MVSHTISFVSMLLYSNTNLNVFCAIKANQILYQTIKQKQKQFGDLIFYHLNAQRDLTTSLLSDLISPI